MPDICCCESSVSVTLKYKNFKLVSNVVSMSCQVQNSSTGNYVTAYCIGTVIPIFADQKKIHSFTPLFNTF